MRVFSQLDQTFLQLFDGRADCSDWSDECPSNMTLRKERSALGSRYQLIGNVFLRVLVWIMGLAAILGNAVGITLVEFVSNIGFPSNSTILANNLYTSSYIFYEIFVAQTLNIVLAFEHKP